MEMVPEVDPFTRMFTPGNGELSSPETIRPETVVCACAQTASIQAADTSSARFQEVAKEKNFFSRDAVIMIKGIRVSNFSSVEQPGRFYARPKVDKPLDVVFRETLRLH